MGFPLIHALLPNQISVPLFFPFLLPPIPRITASRIPVSSHPTLLLRCRGRSSVKYSSKFGRIFRVWASSSEPEPEMNSSGASTSAPSTNLIVICSAITVTLSVANRVLYKLALVPMKNYPFFLAQFTTFGYVAVYFSILYGRYQAGIVTDEMLKVPKSRFMAIGALEAIGVAAGMLSAAMLPGPSIPILNQAFLVWQLMFSTIILGRKCSITQIGCCLLVAVAVVVAVASGSNSGEMLSRFEILWPALMIASGAFQAAASILKEFVFIDSAARLKGKTLDIFVVNSFGSGFQAAQCLSVIFLTRPHIVEWYTILRTAFISEEWCRLLPKYGGQQCRLRWSSPASPTLYNNKYGLQHIIAEPSENFYRVVASLAVTLSVPIAIYILSLPLPYLPAGSSLSPFFILGSAILVLGLVFYNLRLLAKQNSKIV